MENKKRNIYLVYCNQYDHSIIDSSYSQEQFAIQKIKQLYDQLCQQYIEEDDYQVDLQDNQIRVAFQGNVIAYYFIKKIQLVK